MNLAPVLATEAVMSVDDDTAGLIGITYSVSLTDIQCVA